MKFRFGIQILFIFLAMLHNSSELNGDVHNHKLCEGFLPENDLQIPVPKPGSFKALSGLNESEFNRAVDKVTRVYSSLFTSKGKRLMVKKLWSNTAVNAVAYMQNGYSIIEIFGGLARHEEMTLDGLTLVTCHEVGHHLGGYPKYSDPDSRWASVEGQADYFSTMKCLRKVFESEADSWSGFVDPVAKSKCEASFGVDSRKTAVCGRMAMASMASARLSNSLSGFPDPRFDIYDRTIVSRTFESHPNGQCRLDTYVRGGLCQTADNTDFSDRSEDPGACRNIASEEYGARARCWFKSAHIDIPDPNPQPPPAPAPDPNPLPNPDPLPLPDPTPEPPPIVRGQPLLNGVVELVSHNPAQSVLITWDLSQQANVGGVYLEIIGPNFDFADPNSLRPDPRAIRVGTIPGRSGRLSFLPSRELRGWGIYKVRWIPMNRTGRVPVAGASRASALILAP